MSAAVARFEEDDPGATSREDWLPWKWTRWPDAGKSPRRGPQYRLLRRVAAEYLAALERIVDARTSDGAARSAPGRDPGAPAGTMTRHKVWRM
jgi:hypothetical protein